MTHNLTIDLTDEYGVTELGDALDRLSREAWAYLITWAEPGEVLFVEALTCVSVYGGTGFDSLHRTHADARNRVLELVAAPPTPPAAPKCAHHHREERRMYRDVCLTCGETC